MMVCGGLAKNMEKVFFNMLMVASMKDNILMICFMVKESENGQTVTYTKVCGKPAPKMATVCIDTQMEIPMKVLGKI
jgi:hypothetical protein